jgi:DNA invertase Pin-like site-specific DNA recombinase
MKRAAIYARVSVPRLQDAEEKVSIEAQVRDCEEVCRAKGYQVVARYIDNAPYRVKGRLVDPSGTRSDRPQYLAMLEAARRGEFDVIVAWKEDRLCRGIYSAVPLGRVLEETKVAVELVKETFDPGMFFYQGRHWQDRGRQHSGANDDGEARAAGEGPPLGPPQAVRLRP